MLDSGETDAGRPGALAGRRPRLVITAFLGILALFAAGCSGVGARPVAQAKAQRAASAARLTITPASGMRNTRPGQGVTVAASHGTVKNVTVTSGRDPVSGYLNATRTVWHSRWALQPSHDYTVTATAVDPSGRP